MEKIYVYNDKYDEINVLHYQGESIKSFENSFDNIKNNALLNQIPQNLSLISCWTDDSKCHLLHQLNQNNIQLINAIPNDYDYSQPWDMRNKIKFYINTLENLDTQYCMLLDGYDVLFCSTDNIIEKFKDKGYKIIFNTTVHNYPPENIDNVINRDNYGYFKYFNAGCCIGYRTELLKFYKECLNYLDIENELKSEQKILRHVFANYSNNLNQDFIFFDFRRNIFHTMGYTMCYHKYGTNEYHIKPNIKGIQQKLIRNNNII